MLEVKRLSLSYALEGNTVDVLRELNLSISAGEFVGIQGPSGSGKSTLFYILGFLLKPSAGQVIFDDIDITQLNEEQLTLLRNRKIGFIFQQFHLLPKANVLENILMPSRYPSELAPSTSRNEKALLLAKQLGLQNHLQYLPNQLSGGQQQRVAIARALLNDIDFILADEPTGNLDSHNAAQILDLLTELNKQGKTIVLITHDAEVAKRCSKVYHMKDGTFVKVVENFSPTKVSISPKKTHPQSLRIIPSFDNYRRIVESVLPLVAYNLLRNKTKSLLTMLGVVIGVAAVLAMVTLGQFAKQRILETYESLGVNKLIIRGYANWNLKASDKLAVNFRSFDSEKDLKILPQIFPEINLMSPTMNSWNSRAIAGGREVGEDQVQVLGVGPQYFKITNRSLLAGQSLNIFHVENRNPVCVIGYGIAERLFSHSNALGEILNVTNGNRMTFPCRIIGVLNSISTNNERNPPNLNIFIPYTYFQTVTDSWWNAQIRSVAIQVNAGADVEMTGKKIKSYFESKYGKSGQFNVDSDSTLVAQMRRFLNIFSLLLTAIAFLSLVVGGIGINNMMLVSVTERIKEFGLRKALGATNRSIRVQVLLESVCLCVVAGFIGILFGFISYELMIFGATKFVPNLKFQWVFEPLAAILSLLSIIAVGIASGFVPALRAEKLQVIEALRSE